VLNLRGYCFNSSAIFPFISAISGNFSAS
jgi:hypothetical protein